LERAGYDRALMPSSSDSNVELCPACGAELPALAAGKQRIACPACTHVFAASDEVPMTGAHTPQAKRASMPPAAGGGDGGGSGGDGHGDG
jgi:hypothetical protein